MRNLLKIELNPKRVYGLDILRALAILFVVVEHGRFLLPHRLEFIHQFVIFDGVSIFFVLSGFLIGGILIKIFEERGSSNRILLDFWIRRWFRTLPNYFLILIILGTLSVLFTEDFSFYQIRRYFIFSQNLFSEHPEFFPEAWSLSIEEWYYLLIPISIFLLIRVFNHTPSRSVLYTAVGILFIITIFRFYRSMNVEISNYEEWDLWYRKQVFTRLDSLMFGMIGAYIQYHFKEKWLRHKKVLLFTGIALFVLWKFGAMSNFFPIDGLYSCVFSFSITSMATLALLPYLSSLKYGQGKLYTFFTYISLISYSMYLINLTLIQTWIIDSIHWSLLSENIYLIIFVKYGLFWSLTITVSILIYKYFEVPVMNLRDHKIFTRRKDKLKKGRQ
jgi:peptidoglycan/LPS O-acetylase OafA/YrhL